MLSHMLCIVMHIKTATQICFYYIKTWPVLKTVLVMYNIKTQTTVYNSIQYSVWTEILLNSSVNFIIGFNILLKIILKKQYN